MNCWHPADRCCQRLLKLLVEKHEGRDFWGVCTNARSRVASAATPSKPDDVKRGDHKKLCGEPDIAHAGMALLMSSDPNLRGGRLSVVMFLVG